MPMSEKNDSFDPCKPTLLEWDKGRRRRRFKRAINGRNSLETVVEGRG